MAASSKFARGGALATASGVSLSALQARLRTWITTRRWLIGSVALPTLVVAVYMYAFAANQYVSESRFIIRASPSSSSSSGLGALDIGQMGSGNTGGASDPGNAAPTSGIEKAAVSSGLNEVTAAAGSSEDAAAVASFIDSDEAVRRLTRTINLDAVWRRNGIDVVNGLQDNATIEDVSKRYHQRVKATSDGATPGVVRLTVRTFRPEDSRRINRLLLDESESLIVRLAQRAQRDRLRNSEDEVRRASQAFEAFETRMTSFRDRSGALDPSKSALVVNGVVSGLEAQLARAKAESAAQRAFLTPASPTSKELQTRAAALTGELARQHRRLTGGQGSLAPAVAGYEGLTIDRLMAMRDYAVAVRSLAMARIDVQQQRAYLVRVEEPSAPVKSTYPMRFVTVLCAFGLLLAAYGVAWLIIVGFREHAVPR